MTEPPDEPLEARTAILRTFEQMGGLKRMAQWAKTHQREFYSQIFTKLLPLAQVNTQVNVVNLKDDADEARAKLKDMIMRIIDAREADEAMGIFHDEQGVIITDPERIRLEQQIYDLKRKRAAAGIIDVAPTVVAPPEAAAPSDVNSHPAPNVVHPAAFKRAVDPQPPPAASYQPVDWGNSTISSRSATPATPAPERSTTQRYLDWANAGGLDMWSPGSGWSRLP